MLDIATEAFCQLGYAGVSMNEIAARCGITKPMLYLYFGSKEGLYLACLRFVGDALIESITTTVASARTPTERVFATAAGLFRYAEQRDRAWWGVIYAETMPTDSAVVAAMMDYRARILAVISSATRQLLPDPTDAEVAAHALIGAGEALLRWWVLHPEESADDVMGRVQRIIGPLLEQNQQQRPDRQAERPDQPAISGASTSAAR